MKKFIIPFILFFSVVSLAFAEEVEQPKLKNGFRDLRFGDKISDVEGLVSAGKIEDYATYRRPSDLLMLGKTRLDSISYWFWDGRFACVVLEKKTTVLSKSDTEISDFLVSVYGKPTQTQSPDSNATVKICKDIWEDQKTCIIHTVMFSLLSEENMDIAVVVKSKEIDAERMSAKGEINSKSPSGL